MSAFIAKWMKRIHKIKRNVKIFKGIKKFFAKLIGFINFLIPFYYLYDNFLEDRLKKE